jgi:hypothetical protein
MRIAVLDKGQSCNDVPGVDQDDLLRLSLVTAQMLLRDVMSRRCEGILAEVPSHFSKFTYHPLSHTDRSGSVVNTFGLSLFVVTGLHNVNLVLLTYAKLFCVLRESHEDDSQCWLWITSVVMQKQEVSSG